MSQPPSSLEQRKVTNIRIPNILGYEKIAIAAVEIIAGKMRFPTHKIDDMKLAVAEAVTNAIEHGNQKRPDASVTISIVERAGSLLLRVTDEGHKPLPKDFPVDRTGRLDNRGWGTKLISDLMDKAVARAHPGRNEIEMIAYLD